jgi:hypothetical protein
MMGNLGKFGKLPRLDSRISSSIWDIVEECAFPVIDELGGGKDFGGQVSWGLETYLGYDSILSGYDLICTIHLFFHQSVVQRLHGMQILHCSSP